MPYEALEFEVDGRLAIIKLNRPDRLNALNEQLIKELHQAISDVANKDEIGGLMLTGNGRGFCAGADITQVNFDKSPGPLAEQGELSYQTLLKYLNPLIQMIHDMEKPVVAAVNGMTAGYGVSLALICDIVFAAESAKFIQVFLPRLGVVPDGGATWMLPRLTTRARAIGMMLTGDKITAKKAEEWGMIWKCLPDEEMAEAAYKTAHKLAHGPSLGLSSLKLAVKQSDDNSLEQQLRLEAYLQKSCCGSADFAEGCAAFVQKREPNFTSH